MGEALLLIGYRCRWIDLTIVLISAQIPKTPNRQVIGTILVTDAAELDDSVRALAVTLRAFVSYGLFIHILSTDGLDWHYSCPRKQAEGREGSCPGGHRHTEQNLGRQSPMPITLRIATFNLENLDDKPGQKPTLSERIALMRPQLLRLNADILCLQEVNGQEESGPPRRLLALAQLLGQ